MHPDDAEVVRGLMARDEKTFTTLVQSTHGRLVAMANRLLGDEASAEDVAQETWRRVVRSLATFDGRSRLETWIVQIARNRALTRLAAKKRELHLESDTFDPTGAWFDRLGQWKTQPSGFSSQGTPESAVESRELRDVVTAALETLPERQRLVVTLRDVEGLEASVVCETLGISAENQRVLLHRGRATLREAVLKALGEKSSDLA